MKNILFPSIFRLIGWIIFLPSVISGALCYFNLISPVGLWQTVVHDAIIIGLALGSLFIVCSKERQEDEMIRAIRLASLFNSIYANVIILVTGTLFINGTDYQEFLKLNLGLSALIFVFIYSSEIYRHSIQYENEE